MAKEVYLSVILPVYNEEKLIDNTVCSIIYFLESQGYSYEVIAVDDGSNDNTKSILEEVKKKFNNLVVISNDKNYGKGYSVRKGMILAKGKYRMFMDADNSTDIRQASFFMCFLENGFDVVIGSRRLDGSKILKRQSFLKETLGNFGNIIIKKILIEGIDDTQCGFKCFKDDFVKKIYPKLTINRWGFDVELLAVAKKFGYKIKILPVSWKNRKESRVRFTDYFLTLYEIFRIKTNLITKVYE